MSPGFAEMDRLAGQRIRELRAEQGMSQLELSMRATAVGLQGWSQSRVHRAEAGKQGLNLADVGGLADIFGVSPAEFLRIDEDMTVAAAHRSLLKVLGDALPLLEKIHAERGGR